MKIIIQVFGRLLTCVCITLSSCDPYGGYEYRVDNNSDSTITVVYSEINNDSIKNKLVGKDESLLLSKYSTINGIYDLGEDFLDGFDSIAILHGRIKKIKIKKEYNSRDQWDYHPEVTNSFIQKSGDNIYKFIIENKDL